MLIKIPQKFLIDHEERDLPTPVVHKSTKACFWIDTGDSAFGELLSDAKFYADDSGPDDITPGLRVAARALVKAMTE